ncbi:MAG: hypothetical protein JXR37_23010 [Kiritimatiellae bacterium]|nr:hypothetical protein [Kiritimatiellia bacterium]
MKRTSGVLLSCCLAAAICGLSACAAENGDPVRLFDTGRHREVPWPADALVERAGWTELDARSFPRDALAHDLCLANSRLLIVFRRGGPGPEIYYRIAETLRLAAVVTPADETGRPHAALARLQARENNAQLVVLTAQFGGPAGAQPALEFTLRADRPDLEVRFGPNVSGCRLQHASEYAVMPDFFGNDLVWEARTGRSAPLHLPPDNLFLLHLIDHGDAILMCDWREEPQSVTTAPGSDGSRQLFMHTQIESRDAGRVWVSVLAAPGIWRDAPCSELSVLEDRKIDWQPPFRAAWRLDFRRNDEAGNGLIDSWYGVFKAQDGKKYDAPIPNRQYGPYWLAWPHIQNHATRNAWYSGLGDVIHPFCIDGREVTLRLPKFRSRDARHITYDGMALVYPLLRADRTPAQAVLPFDILQQTLGDDCENVLDITDLKDRSRKDVYPATCGVTAKVKRFFDDHKEKEAKQEIMKELGRMDLFVKNMRARIEEYTGWAARMQQFYEARLRATPALADALQELAHVTARIPADFAEARERMQTPEDAATLSQQLIALIDDDQPDKIDRCDQLGRQIRIIGGTQDTLLGKCRRHTKMLRQKAGLLYAASDDPRLREIAAAVRQHTREMLRVRFGMEGK